MVVVVVVVVVVFVVAFVVFFAGRDALTTSRATVCGVHRTMH